RWRYMLFDLNQETMNIKHIDEDNIAMALESDAVFAAAFENRDFRQEFFEKLRELEKGPCSPENAEREIAEIEDTSAFHMALWYERFFNGAVGEEGYHKKAEELKEYFRRRPAAVERLIEKYDVTEQ
ncbi:MAG: CotH kinase family protein, partial [Lachnospiraceae bacterium]|nr:CotH kinase family protein [Lachnospiraceae bacterium]